MDDFLAAVDGRQAVKIIIDGETISVARRRLLAHLHLSEIEIKIKAASGPVLISALIIEYLSVAGLTDDQIKKASTYEILDAFFALRQLNAWQWLLPWLANSTDVPGDPEFYDYSGRRWAMWVHRLASRYGWSRDQIFNLWPEEAAAYIQEIMVSEYHEREDKRALSELSYRYDKATKMSNFIPSPRYSWMVDESNPDPIKTPVRLLPVGNVVSMHDEGEQ
jgi:hypothetical protein